MNTKVEPGQNSEVKLLTADECLVRAVELMAKAAPAFARAAGEIDEVEAIRLCAMGKAFCFIGESNYKLTALLIAVITDYPLKRICDVLAYAGTARDFYWFQDELDNWARAQGACEMRGYGKEGPMRLARRHGYQEVYRVYTKPLLGKEVK